MSKLAFLVYKMERKPATNIDSCRVTKESSFVVLFFVLVNEPRRSQSVINGIQNHGNFVRCETSVLKKG